ncbi:hypothetical protein JVT61DRAFT_9034 [Boletus reticuloceps]|uniref:Uncharacterized protein n=1 Tax=Boletus reticuloceps TaxID=495285 RepID=A0A8I3A4Y0_9AGAM|nr:hypothetical protein JVT61DRAFT_9034 [Boletus reticuloceps]
MPNKAKGHWIPTMDEFHGFLMSGKYIDSHTFYREDLVTVSAFNGEHWQAKIKDIRVEMNEHGV